jgi:MerR family transcriptional regulator, redox-sensitive transcriptional activator SoxR
MSIGEVASRVGMRASALRYYERLGLLPRAARKSGRRVYDERAIHRLNVICFARATGFTLREIRKLFDGHEYSIGLRTLAASKMKQLDQVIERARTMQRLLKSALRCNCLSLEDCGRRLHAYRGAKAMIAMPTSDTTPPMTSHRSGR